MEGDQNLNYEDFDIMMAQELMADDRKSFLELGRRQKSLRVSFADSDIKRADQNRPRFRKNFNQFNFESSDMPSLLKTPGAAQTLSKDLAHEF